MVVKEGDFKPGFLHVDLEVKLIGPNNEQVGFGNKDRSLVLFNLAE